MSKSWLRLPVVKDCELLSSQGLALCACDLRVSKDGLVLAQPQLFQVAWKREPPWPRGLGQWEALGFQAFSNELSLLLDTRGAFLLCLILQFHIVKVAR